jgi:hypothetical protein
MTLRLAGIAKYKLEKIDNASVSANTIGPKNLYTTEWKV